MSTAAGHATRRVVLVAAAGALLGGCGVRLEDDAPRLPLLPTREPIPAEADLLQLLEDTHALAVLTRGADQSRVAELSRLHGTQADVLAAALVRSGVPENDVARAVSSGSPTPSATSRVRPREVGAEEGAALNRAPVLFARVQADLVPTTVALHAQRAATATQLGSRVKWPSPTAWPAPSAAVPYLTATRAAAYGFEVVAAQVEERSRDHAVRTLGVLRGLADEQEGAASAEAPDPELGYPLPFRVTGPRRARRLATRLLADLRASYGAQLSDVAGHRSVAMDVTRWLAAGQREAQRWGSAQLPFPGLTIPS